MHTNERWGYIHDDEALASYVDFGLGENVPCVELSWTRCDTSKEEQAYRAERIVACYNACLMMADPEEDVKAMVGALQKVYDYGHETLIEHALGSAWLDVKTALARVQGGK